MSARAITGWFLVGLVLLIAGYDVWAIVTSGKDASISQVLIDYAYDYPSFSFLAGFVCGHIFWRMPDRKKDA
jgi:hypothetical protein